MGEITEIKVVPKRASVLFNSITTKTMANLCAKTTPIFAYRAGLFFVGNLKCLFIPTFLRRSWKIFWEFNLGKLLSFRGIEGGIENTNYFVTTETSELVLTLFEALHESDLTPVLALAYHLGEQGLAVPAPIASHSGALLHKLKNKPAILCCLRSAHSKPIA